MESLGLAPDVMRRRVEETLDLLGLAALRDRPLATLSGGQRQRVAIGSVLTPHPRVLVLDESTSALDPAAAEEVLAVLQRLVHDLGTTVLSGLGPKAVAMLGVLAAAGAALRPLGAGTAGIEPMFFLMVLSGRVLGPGFGFVLGSVTMFASALLTGGVGPGCPSRCSPWAGSRWARGCSRARTRVRGRPELALLAVYGFLAAFAYGTVMNLAGWPFPHQLASSVAFAPDASLGSNLARFLAYCLATSLGWDLGRAAVTVVLTLTLGAPVLKALRRATRRAAFEAPVAFETRAAFEAPAAFEPNGRGPEA